MIIGLLWQFDADDSKRTLREKIARAIAFYNAKYGAGEKGRLATSAYVHPDMLAEEREEDRGWFMLEGVYVKGMRTVLRGHVWVEVRR